MYSSIHKTQPYKEAIINAIIYARRSGYYNDTVLFMYNSIFDTTGDTHCSHDDLDIESIVNFDYYPVWSHIAYAYYKGHIQKDQMITIYDKVIVELICTHERYISIWGIITNLLIVKN